MKPKEYIKKALRTESKDYCFKATGKLTPRIEHAIFGIATESGELVNIIKHCKIYRKDLDVTNLVEEMGDLMWYLALLSDDIRVSFEEVWEKNIKKLEARYPQGYSHDSALGRNLKKERKILEK